LSLLPHPTRGESGLEGAGRCWKRAGHLVYWFITGALLGLSLVENPFLGVILFPVGLVLLVIGQGAVRGRERVAAVLGFGALSAVAFVSVFVFPHFPFVTPFALLGGHVFGVVTLAFGVVTLVGVVALVVVWRTPRRTTGPAKPPA
jgi:hypothetical protein